MILLTLNQNINHLIIKSIYQLLQIKPVLCYRKHCMYFSLMLSLLMMLTC